MIHDLRTIQASAGEYLLTPLVSIRTNPIRRRDGIRSKSWRGMPLRRALGLMGLLVGLSPGLGLGATEIAVPNGSFETPSTSFVSVNIDDWQKPPKPDWYDEGGGFLWEQLTGLFRNPAPASPSHIDNCDGDQALWLFAVPEVALFQELGDATMPSADDVVFESGNAYRLTVGVIGGGGNMLEGVTLELALYYREDTGNPVTVVATSITNSVALFPSPINFVDFEARTPTVKVGDAWAGRPIGIRLLSTVDPLAQGGYWDLDHVRLEAIGPPVLVDVGVTDGVVGFTLESEPGLRFELLASPEAGVPLEEWARLTTLTNVTGRVTYSEPATNSGGRFYRARQLE